VNHQPLSLEQCAQKMGDLLLSGTVVERKAGAVGAFVKSKKTILSRAVSKEKTISAAAAPAKTPKFCPGCGAPVKPGAKFCASCGRPL
ncbi:MAG TPA: zinc ribbon domain-containing protein, partial [Candidatus Cryosericum sp.]